jgi:hypothetical protein
MLPIVVLFSIPIVYSILLVISSILSSTHPQRLHPIAETTKLVKKKRHEKKISSSSHKLGRSLPWKCCWRIGHIANRGYTYHIAEGSYRILFCGFIVIYFLSRYCVEASNFHFLWYSFWLMFTSNFFFLDSVFILLFSTSIFEFWTLFWKFTIIIIRTFIL